MRKILMNEKGEFDGLVRSRYTDYVRSSAVKMIAAMLLRAGGDSVKGSDEVVVFKKVPKRAAP